ncbi:MAG TPA: YciI family protein [Polyangiaceae bacterium]|nr:YciI family protein [Polyangiaceae bacterium]
MSEFVFLLRSDEENYQQAMGTPERAQKSMQAWIAWIKELEVKGQLKSGGMPLERTGKTVRGAQLAVTDGPFTEAKDIVLGFIIVVARDLDHAVEIAKGCPLAQGGGGVEIRPVMEGGTP